MKLIQCHIENFGKLQNQTITFSNRGHCFFYENGWGKSTLAAFLTVMLYGFDKERSRDDYINERKRFRPWQGGVYGGTLTFETEGKTYIIERTFGLKEKEDHFLVREEETNQITDLFSFNLGEELFHLDRDSFEKTVFLSQKDCSTKSTDRILANLGNLALATEDISQYDKAETRLHDILNGMSPNRKTGYLYRLKEQIGDLEAELSRGKILGREIEALELEREQTEQSYHKYKEVQEQLLEEQKKVSLQDRNLQDRSLQDRNLQDRSLADSKAVVPLHLWKSFLSGFLLCGLGILLSFFNKQAGIGLLAVGVSAFVVLIIWYYKKSKKAFSTKNNQVLNTSSKSVEGQIEEELEQVQLRLRKIQIMIENTYRKIVHLDHEIEQKRKKQDWLLEKSEQLDVLKSQYDLDLVKYERLKKTKEYLRMAKEAYLSKYRNPLMQAFSKYYGLLSSGSKSDCRIDSNLNLTFTEYGIQRESRYFSEGYKDLFGICMRLALIEVMYGAEKPFLILDDPFVNLDQKKTETALGFLRNLGTEYQILYFTCHESRALNTEF